MLQCGKSSFCAEAGAHYTTELTHSKTKQVIITLSQQATGTQVYITHLQYKSTQMYITHLQYTSTQMYITHLQYTSAQVFITRNNSNKPAGVHFT